MAAALKGEKFRNRTDAVEALQETGYKPTLVHATGKYAFASSFVGKFFSINLSHQPENMASFGMAKLVTALSVEEWMKKNNLLTRSFEIELSDEEKLAAQYWIQQVKEAEKNKAPAKVLPAK